jgi:hypothetical protein
MRWFHSLREVSCSSRFEAAGGGDTGLIVLGFRGFILLLAKCSGIKRSSFLALAQALIRVGEFPYLIRRLQRTKDSEAARCPGFVW